MLNEVLSLHLTLIAFAVCAASSHSKITQSFTKFKAVAY